MAIANIPISEYHYSARCFPRRFGAVKGNETLVFDPGNQFTDDLAAPYTVLPSSWRSFIFRLLKPREFALYLYICSLCDKNSVAYPSIGQMQTDLEIASTTTITASLKRLEHLGFLLRQRGVLPRKTSRPHQNIYQRPSIHFTIHRLLQLGEIDTHLNRITLVPQESRISRAAVALLKKVMADRYMSFDSAPDSERKEILLDALREAIDSKRRDGTLHHELFSKRGAARAADRMRKAEDELWSIVLRHARQLNSTDERKAAFTEAATNFRILRDELSRAAESKDRFGVEYWLAKFNTVIAGLRPHFSGPTEAINTEDQDAEMQLLFAFERYASVPVSLGKHLAAYRDDAKAPF